MNQTRQQIEHCARRMLELQQTDGRIFWVDGGIFDPWNHTLSAMALQTAGYREQAEAAFACLHDIQQADGSLPGQCGASAPMDQNNRKLLADKASDLTDTNFAAFALLGVFHSWKTHGDKAWTRRQFPLIDQCRSFIHAHQSPHGEIAWRKKEDGEQLEEVDALRTGNCSIYKSLLAAQLLDQTFGREQPSNLRKAQDIQNALTQKPFRFDRTWESKSRFAMDWYYPVLTGVVTGEQAKALLRERYREFVEPKLGCLCVSDQPWVTTAETCELILALLAVGDQKRAQALMDGLAPLRADNGGYWMGWQFEENIFWPEERPSWTAAAVILALDALHKITPAHQVLVGAIGT
jgi:hypothetical protein